MTKVGSPIQHTSNHSASSWTRRRHAHESADLTDPRHPMAAFASISSSTDVVMPLIFTSANQPWRELPRLS